MRKPMLTVVLVPLALAVACGGGGGGGGAVGGSPTPVVVSFTPEVASPVQNTVALREGSKTGDVLLLEVTATDVQSLWSAQFEIVYDDTKVDWDDSPSMRGYSPGTVFEQGGVTPSYTVANPVPGRLIVVVSRLSAGAINVSGTNPMIKLRFRGLTVGSSRLEFQNMGLYGAGVSPPPKPGIAWKGGSVIGS